MSETGEWDRSLADADSTNALAPPGYNHDAVLKRLEALRWRLVSALPAYELRATSPEPLQNSTALIYYYVFASGAGPFAPTRARILLSRFGDLATIRGCRDPKLLASIRDVLDDFALKYVPYDYVASKTYDGKCSALVGSTWETRYFSLTVDLKSK